MQYSYQHFHHHLQVYCVAMDTMPKPTKNCITLLHGFTGGWKSPHDYKYSQMVLDGSLPPAQRAAASPLKDEKPRISVGIASHSRLRLVILGVRYQIGIS